MERSTVALHIPNGSEQVAPYWVSPLIPIQFSTLYYPL